uniref:hypothetical protein n=2 Tax=Shewanella sp. TaxID=50422 RepID=UPI00404739CF
LLHSDALIKNRWTHSEWSLINAEWYNLYIKYLFCHFLVKFSDLHQDQSMQCGTPIGVLYFC